MYCDLRVWLAAIRTHAREGRADWQQLGAARNTLVESPENGGSGALGPHFYTSWNSVLLDENLHVHETPESEENAPV